MREKSRLLLVGLLTLFIGLLVFFPARVAYRWFAPPALALSGISGSLWSGNAREGSASGLYLRDLKWSMRPLAVFTGKLSYQFEASPGGGFADGTISLGLGGAIALTELNAALPLRALNSMLAIPSIGGDVSAKIERLLLDSGIPIAADGVVEVANLLVPSIYRSSIGGYRAEFSTQESGIVASVEDTDGVVDLAGSLQLSKQRHYQFTAQLAPKSDTPAALREQLRFLGSANERGQHSLRLEGEL